MTETAMPPDNGLRPRIMGILNVTPDSFSDGGDFLDPQIAVEHALAMVRDGADIIDIGGESTRPGAEPVAEEAEQRRVLPVIEALADALRDDVAISIDTRSPAVARAALAAGARIVNDVNAARAPGMLEVVAEFGVPVCLMHMQGTPQTMQNDPRYDDVVSEVLEFLLERAEAAEAAGVGREHIVLDPGIGFGKRRDDNLDLIAALPRFVATGYEILLGTSRKRFMGAICAETDFKELVGATCATTALGVAAGVRWFRVHDVKANRQAADVARAILARPAAGD